NPDRRAEVSQGGGSPARVSATNAPDVVGSGEGARRARQMKLQTTLLVAAVLSVGIYLVQRGGMFRATPVAAQTSSQVMQCEALRKHGDPGTTACYQALSRSRDLVLKAEGLWGLRDYFPANDAFRDAVKAKPKDANLKVRWGMLYVENSLPGDAADLFKEALEIDPNNAKALYGMALVASDA